MIRPLLCLAACLYALTASAQWQWLDKDGRKVFSDRPPPAEVPEKNILKRPGRGMSTMPAATTTVAPAPGPTTPSGLDKALQDKKKQADDANAAKRKAEEERIARAKADNCARAQQAKANFDSGIRMARINENGERVIYDDAARAAEVERLQSIINENCR